MNVNNDYAKFPLRLISLYYDSHLIFCKETNLSFSVFLVYILGNDFQIYYFDNYHLSFLTPIIQAITSLCNMFIAYQWRWM